MGVIRGGGKNWGVVVRHFQMSDWPEIFTTYFHKPKELMVRWGRHESRKEDFLGWSSVQEEGRVRVR